MESPFNQIALRSPFFDAGLSVFTPLSLFSASEPGAWYDPSDMSTMFQDAAGATPVTAVEQPVSVILDKSKNGVGTNGTRRLNLIIYTQEFDNAAWSKSNLTVTQNAGVAPDGTTTSDKLIPNTSNVSHFVVPTLYVTPANSLTYIASVYLKADGYRYGAVSDGTTGGALFDLQTGSVVSQDSGITASTPVNAGDGWWRCSISFVASSARRIGIDVFNNSSKTSFAGDGTSGILAWGADLRLAADVNIAPTYQRVTDTWYNVQAGSHAYTPSGATASRPVLSARYNLLTKTEQFDDAAWIKGAVTSSATKITPTVNNAYHNTRQTLTYVATGYRFVVEAKADGYQFLQLFLFSGANYFEGIFNLSGAGSVENTSRNSTWTGTRTITALADGYYRCTITVTEATAGSGGAQVGVSSTSDPVVTYSGDGTSGILVRNADLRVANDGVSLPVYQRVNTSTDYDTTNFPMYLRFDGSDDYMLTGTITPGTDKAQVFAGVRKLSDAAAGLITELSTGIDTNAGALAMFSSASDGTDRLSFSEEVRGAGNKSGVQGRVFTSPVSGVVSALLNITGTTEAAKAALRINGATPTTIFRSSTPTPTTPDTGNFLAYPLYIGRRAGTSLPYNGRLFGLIVRFGANLDNTQITNTETWMNGKTKAY